jgi:hypothetical protein
MIKQYRLKRTRVKLTKEENKLTVSQQILLEKYKLLVTQIIHWDTLFWSKSKFFLAIETAFLATVGAVHSPPLKGKFLDAASAPYVVIILALFNIFLCYVWHRTNKRNLQYRRFKIDEFMEIEKRMPELAIFSGDAAKILIPKSGRSARWEMSLPFAFALLWCLVFGWQCKGI